MTDIAKTDAVLAPRAADPARGRTRAFGYYATFLVGGIVLAVLPLIFRSGLALTLMSLIGISIIFALSYNMLLGQTGLLSFGHAVYYGLGAFCAVHVMNAVIARGLPIPLPLMPLVGGLGGLFFGLLFGWVSTRRGGTVFAMISLGLAELVASSANVMRGFFGGEEGITTNRTKLYRVFDLSFGPQIQVYYLIAAWCLLCVILMYALTRTPLGRMCNAVRENPERAEFVGYDPQTVRFIAFALSSFFAGIAGSLAAINFEIVNSAYVGLQQSGIVLLAAFIGGVGYFFGPIIGAIVVTYLQVMLSDVTEVWQLYFGLMFIAVVMFAPGGIAGLLIMHAPFWRAGTLHRVLPAYVVSFIPALLCGLGLALVIEMVFRLTVRGAEGPSMRFLYIPISAHSAVPWIVAALMIIGGFLLFRATWPLVARSWHRAATPAVQVQARFG